MRLTPTQVARFQEDGFLVLPDLFSPREVAVLRAAAQTPTGTDQIR